MIDNEIVGKYLREYFKCGTLEEVKSMLKELEKSSFGFIWSYKIDKNGIGMDYSNNGKRTLIVTTADETKEYSGIEFEKLIIKHCVNNNNLGGLFENR